MDLKDFPNIWEVIAAARGEGESLLPVELPEGQHTRYYRFVVPANSSFEVIRKIKTFFDKLYEPVVVRGVEIEEMKKTLDKSQVIVLL